MFTHDAVCKITKKIKRREKKKGKKLGIVLSNLDKTVGNYSPVHKILERHIVADIVLKVCYYMPQMTCNQKLHKLFLLNI